MTTTPTCRSKRLETPARAALICLELLGRSLSAVRAQVLVPTSVLPRSCPGTLTAPHGQQPWARPFLSLRDARITHPVSDLI